MKPSAWIPVLFAVAPGTYTGPGNVDLDFLGKAIVVRSTDPLDPAVVLATVIDCEGDGGGFRFLNGKSLDSTVVGKHRARRETGKQTR